MELNDAQFWLWQNGKQPTIITIPGIGYSIRNKTMWRWTETDPPHVEESHDLDKYIFNKLKSEDYHLPFIFSSYRNAMIAAEKALQEAVVVGEFQL